MSLARSLDLNLLMEIVLGRNMSKFKDAFLIYSANFIIFRAYSLYAVSYFTRFYCLRVLNMLLINKT